MENKIPKSNFSSENYNSELRQSMCTHEHYVIDGKYESPSESDKYYYKCVVCGYTWVGY